MIQNTTQSVITIAVIAVTILATRALPFLLFPANRETTKLIVYLGKVLPSAIIGMLIVYCLKGVSVFAGSHGLPEAIAIICVAAVHHWKHNLILSIGGGTVLYMFLVQVVFI